MQNTEWSTKSTMQRSESTFCLIESTIRKIYWNSVKTTIVTIIQWGTLSASSPTKPGKTLSTTKCTRTSTVRSFDSPANKWKVTWFLNRKERSVASISIIVSRERTASPWKYSPVGSASRSRPSSRSSGKATMHSGEIGIKWRMRSTFGDAISSSSRAHWLTWTTFSARGSGTPWKRRKKRAKSRSRSASCPLWREGNWQINWTQYQIFHSNFIDLFKDDRNSSVTYYNLIKENFN